MSRTANIKRNLTFNIVKYVVQLVLQFVLRTCMIYIMGAEYLGLNGLFTNIFGFLSLAELGIGSAIVFSMYKPIADGDIEKVKALQNVYKKFYFIISLVVLAVGLLILPFLKYLISGEVGVNINIYILYLLYLVNTLLGYFSAHKRSLLFAYQRNDVENKAKTGCLLLMTLLQIAVLVIFKNYYIFFIVNIVFTVVESVVIYYYAKKLFPDIVGKAQPLDKETNNEIKKNVAALSLHKVGWVIVFSTDNILISAMLGLTILGAYSNYYLIVSSLMAIFTLLISALTGSVGNLIASTDKEYVYTKYKTINFLFSLLTTFCTVCMLVLFQPFITAWTSGDPIYLLKYSSVILICLSFYLNRMRTCVNVFKESAGLFKQDQWKPIVEAIVNLVASIVLGIYMGLNGIILGTIISTIVAPLWVEPWVLYKHYFKKNVWEYFKTYIRDVVIMIVTASICYVICALLPVGGLWWLILKFAVCAVLCVAVMSLLYSPVKEFRSLLSSLKEKVKIRLSKKTSK